MEEKQKILLCGLSRIHECASGRWRIERANEKRKIEREDREKREKERIEGGK